MYDPFLNGSYRGKITKLDSRSIRDDLITSTDAEESIIIPNHFILVSLDSSFHQLSMDSKFMEFRVHLTLQFDV